VITVHLNSVSQHRSFIHGLKQYEYVLHQSTGEVAMKVGLLSEAVKATAFQSEV